MCNTETQVFTLEARKTVPARSSSKLAMFSLRTSLVFSRFRCLAFVVRMFTDHKLDSFRAGLLQLLPSEFGRERHGIADIRVTG